MLYTVYLTIIPRGHVGYGMIDSQRGAKRRVGYNHLISNKHEWNNCFIKNSPTRTMDNGLPLFTCHTSIKTVNARTDSPGLHE